MKIQTVGFIGQGWIGSNYADWFEQNTDLEIVRYDIEKYKDNKDKIKDCDLVFICVPTPTTPQGFDISIVESVLQLVGKGKIALIKSTILPGTTQRLQEQNPDIVVLFSPEFLAKKTVKQDVAEPDRGIVGWTAIEHEPAAQAVLAILPKAPYMKTMPAQAAELVKYAANCFLYTKVVYANVLYDLCQALDVDYELVAQGMGHDKRIGMSHLKVVFDGGRGAASCCFLKDMEAFRQYFDKHAQDENGTKMLDAIIQKNLQLLKDTQKDLDYFCQVYGDDKA